MIYAVRLSSVRCSVLGLGALRFYSCNSYIFAVTLLTYLYVVSMFRPVSGLRILINDCCEVQNERPYQFFRTSLKSALIACHVVEIYRSFY